MSILETERLILRPWKESDKDSLFEYAKDPDVGPRAGWPPHKNTDESLFVIKNVLCQSECYAICLKGTDKAIGCIELKLNGHSDLTKNDDECELGYWLGKPFWGQGIMPEAGDELIRRGFDELGMKIIWCGYFDGNTKSKRVQEKLGFEYAFRCDDFPLPLLNSSCVAHATKLTYERWQIFKATPHKQTVFLHNRD